MASIDPVDEQQAAEAAEALAAGSESGAEPSRMSRINSDCVPQAFSHFTIAYSERPLSSFVGPSGKRGRCLVCDLQGCFDKRLNTFLLSDPVPPSPRLLNASPVRPFLRAYPICRAYPFARR